MNEAQDKPKKNPKVNREERRAHWRRQIELALRSKMPISRFCRENAISLPSFNYWRQALKEKNSESESGTRNFVRVKISEEVPQGIRLELGRGIQLRFDREPSAAWICEVAESLKETQS